MPADSDASGAAAIEVFADWLSRRGQGDVIEFEAIVRAHPNLEAELAELHATWERLAQASALGQSSLQERIQSRFGKASLTHVSLREREESSAPSDLSSQLVARLSSHSTRFGRYTIRGEVARGGMGAILKIWDEELRRHLAMKVILGQAQAPEGGGTPPIDSSKVARFLEEAQVTGQLDHPGIVPVHELGLDPEGRLYFTMKLVKGESLHAIFEHLREGQHDWSQMRALNVLLKVCEAMAYAHDKGVIHRDLKPANVMVGKFGEVHVMDWGLARIEGQKDRKDIRIREEFPRTSEMRSVRSDERGESPDSPLYTMDGDVVGTPAYMPPEQAAGKVDEVGPHSDVYALGAMLYHLIAGHPPYIPRGVRLNNYAVWARVQEGPPTALAQLAPATPPELLAICDKAMAREWKQRYRDMSDLAGDLAAYLNQRVVHAYETGAWAEARKWVQRNKPLAASLAAAILLLVAGLGTSLAFRAQAETKAADLLSANIAIEAQKTQLQDTNRQLGSAKTAADESARTATEQERRTNARKNEVLWLSGFQTLHELTAEADQLWPAEPTLVKRMEAWVGRAQSLLMRTPEFTVALQELEKRALPQTEDERVADRIGHPRYAELQGVEWLQHHMSRLLGDEPWPTKESVEALLDRQPIPTDFRGLYRLANSLCVSPEHQVFGGEVEAWILAERALNAATSPAERLDAHRTLTRALIGLGDTQAALEQARAGLADCDPDLRAQYEKLVAECATKLSQQTPAMRAKVAHSRDELAAVAPSLEREVSMRRSWSFPEERDRWWHSRMQELLTALSSFGHPEEGLVYGLVPAQSWGVARRLAFASVVGARSLSGPDAQRRWVEALEAIAHSDKYKGTAWPGKGSLTPQLGLVPIGADAESGLWEFSHLATSENFEPAQRGSDGRIVRTEGMGLVFVLMPGGSFRMGAQRADPGRPNYDAAAQPDEFPVHDLTLDPYFVSKYELTQGQWIRMTGANPSMFPGDKYDPQWNRERRPWSALQPVTLVGWNECTTQLQRMGLALPTEAQWECACRAGTSTRFACGNEAEDLREVGNIADAFALAHGGTGWRSPFEEWDDGNTCLSEVGQYHANGYGLHDVHGNVAEWTRSAYDGDYLLPTRGPDGARVTVPMDKLPSGFVSRGGSYTRDSSAARSAARRPQDPNVGEVDVGLRPVRSVVP